MGFEPTTYWLQISCTTIVLRWQKLHMPLHHTAFTTLKKMVGLSRFELKTQLPKSCVLPLHHRPIKNTIIVAEAGLEPARSLLTRRFSCHACFYASQLIALPLVFCLESTDVYTVVRRIKHSQKRSYCFLYIHSLHYLASFSETIIIPPLPFHV